MNRIFKILQPHSTTSSHKFGSKTDTSGTRRQTRHTYRFTKTGCKGSLTNTPRKLGAGHLKNLSARANSRALRIHHYWGKQRHSTRANSRVPA